MNHWREVLISSSDYPLAIKGIFSPPQKLFLLGKYLETDSLAVAIVGSRQMSVYGERVAKMFAEKLAEAGVTIVSGMARGIDSVAHRAALNVGGRTIAILGSGRNNIYPPENKELLIKISKSGVVITQFEENVPPLGKNFLIRNRLIAALSKVVIVVEGKKRSGTLSTATHAANLGREVFAVPGPIDSELSELPHHLIENGAQVATSVDRILEYLQSQL